MKTIVKEFLVKNHNKERPLLLALSGGADSLALFWILRELKSEMPLTFAVAHVDHGWRSTSSEEAQHLKTLSESMQIPFHLKVLDSTNMTGNKENACRQERLNFFRNLSQQHNYQAVLLGHHADDQAETVLKRLFEGAGLTALGSLRQINEIDGLQLWRPFLSVPKKMILEYCQNHSLIPIDDYTNRDIRFTRAKFREQIIPALSQQFGKEISSSLNRLGHEALTLSDYLDHQIAGYLPQIVEGPFGSMLNLQNSSEIHVVELKHLVERFFQRHKISLSYEEIGMIVEFLRQGHANKLIRSEKSGIYVDRKRLFLVDKLSSQFIPLKINHGSITHNEWLIEAKEINVDKHFPPSDWQAAWKRSVQVALPKGEYTLALATPNSPYGGSSSLSKVWNDAKVPAFLRNLLPVVMCNGSVVHEFLTGKQKLLPKPGQQAENLMLKLTKI